MTFIFILIFYELVSRCVSDCPPYSCFSNNLTCVNQISTSNGSTGYEVSSCDNGYECQIEHQISFFTSKMPSFQVTTLPCTEMEDEDKKNKVFSDYYYYAFPDQLRTPGRNCLDSKQCASKSCVNGLCAGLKEGVACDKYKKLFCDVGLYCSGGSSGNGTCQYQKALNVSCTSDYECKNNAFCNTVTGVCTEYFSVNKGYKVKDQVGFTLQCISHYTNNYTCFDPPFSLYDHTAIPCNDSFDCKLSGVRYSTCYCGLNNGNLKYCQRAEGDPSYDLLHEKYSLLFTENGGCETEDRFSPDCPSVTNLMSFILDLEKFNYLGNMFVGAPDCVNSSLGYFLRSEFNSISFLNTELVEEYFEMEEEAIARGKEKKAVTAGGIVLLIVISLCILASIAFCAYKLVKIYKNRKKKKMQNATHTEKKNESKPNENDETRRDDEINFDHASVAKPAKNLKYTPEETKVNTSTETLDPKKK